jgi:acetyltransferase
MDTLMKTPGGKILSGAKLAIDPAHDLLRAERRPLDNIFNPKSVAAIGASEREGSVGRQVLWNLLSTPFGGTVRERRAQLGLGLLDL